MLHIKTLLMLLTVMTAGFTGTFAQRGNTLSLGPATGAKGESVAVPIILNNSSEVTALDFMISVPGYVGLRHDASTPIAERDPGMQYVCTSKDWEGSNLRHRFMAFSPSNAPFSGNGGTVAFLTIDIPYDFNDDFLPISISDIVIADRDGENVATSFSASGMVAVTPCPDLEADNLSLSAYSFMPGDILQLSWTVTNIGAAPTRAGWREYISLVDAQGNESASLGTTYHNGILPSGESVMRQAEVNVPLYPGIFGDVRLRVTVFPDHDCGEGYDRRDNNNVYASGLSLGRKLYLSPVECSIGEEWTDGVWLSADRSWWNGDHCELAISADPEGVISFPATLRFDAYQSSLPIHVVPVDNDLVDGDRTVTLRISCGDSSPAEAAVTVIDNEYPMLTLSLSTDHITEGETALLTIASNRASISEPLEVNLECDHAGLFVLPSTVVIPAGSRDTTVVLRSIDNDIADHTRDVLFSAAAPLHEEGYTELLVADNDIPEIELLLSPATVNEDAGLNAINATLRRTSLTDKKVTVELSDNSGGSLYFPSRRMVLDKGQTEARFNIGVVDDSEVQGDRDVTVSAGVFIASCSCAMEGSEAGSVQVTVRILDNDGPALSARSSMATVAEGGRFFLEATRNTPTADPLEVTVGATPAGVVEVPASFTIPAGARSASVEALALPNDVEGDSRTVSFTLAASGHASSSAHVMITDATLADAVVRSLSVADPEPLAGQTVEILLTLANEGVVALDPIELNVFAGNSPEPASRMWLHEPLDPGDAVVLPGRISLPLIAGDLSIRAEANPERIVNELSFDNNVFNTRLSLGTPFAATVHTAESVYPQGSPVLIEGIASGPGAASANVEVFVMSTSTRQKFTATTDSDGRFSVEFTPASGQSGHFAAGACFPGESDPIPSAEFDILGIHFSGNPNVRCETVVGIPFETDVRILNPGRIPMTGVTAEAMVESSAFSVEIDSPGHIDAESSASFRISILANEPSATPDWIRIPVTFRSAEGATTSATLFCFSRVASGELSSSVAAINGKMTKGLTRSYPIEIANTGAGSTGEISVTLPQADWLRSATPTSLPALAPGEKTNVILLLSPSDDMPLNLSVSGSIGISCANGNGLAIPFVLETVSETLGMLDVEVCDEYTYYTSEAPRVKGAGVALLHPATGAVVATALTGDNGHALLEVPEGYYTLAVSENAHDSWSSSVIVEPASVTSRTVNLSVNAVKVDWKVEETEIEDEYRIVTTVTYETNVPAPAVVLDLPPVIDADKLAVGESMLFYAVLTNKGLIAAKDPELALPNNVEWLEFEALDVLPAVLNPQQSVAVAIKVTRRAAPSQAPARAGGKNGSACNGDLGVLYFWDCGPDRKWHRYKAVINFMGGCSQLPPSSDDGPGGWGGSGLWDLYWSLPSGPGGGSVPPSSGSSDYPKIDWPTADANDCEPCQNEFLLRLVDCGVQFIPVVGDLVGAIECLGEGSDCANQLRKASEENNPGEISEECMRMITKIVRAQDPCSETGIEWIDKVIKCLKPFMIDCKMPDEDLGRRAPAADPTPGYMKQFASCVDLEIKAIEAYTSILLEVYGSDVWKRVSPDAMAILKKGLEEIALPDGRYDTDRIESLEPMRPAEVSRADILALVERLNNNVLRVQGEKVEGNVADFGVIASAMESIREIENIVYERGYADLAEMYEEEFDIALEAAEDNSGSVCASVSLQFSQTMTLTRQAFRGTLTVFNGSEGKPMEDVRLSLSVRDSNGRLATSREFAIACEELTGFVGNAAIGDPWSLAAGATGVAGVLFVPSRYAAPEEPEVYSFGGSLSYIDPFSGLLVTRDLYPARLTVKPAPELDLTYFMQRDVAGDDPLTEDIEPSVPAEFSLLIFNKGFGEASNVRMITEQPRIIDNEKGLLIDFELLSAQLNGEGRTMALGESVPVDFGNIPPRSGAFAQWWYSSSLLGHFTSYNVEATHVGSFGNPDLSLLDQVTIHELVRSLRIPGGSATDVAFMTNDDPDAADSPDHIFFTDNTSAPVGSAEATMVAADADMTFLLTVTPRADGWVYGSVADPTAGLSSIESVTRVSDGMEMPLRNFWLTDRTLRDGRDPLYENRLHFADNSHGETQCYRVRFLPAPAMLLAVESIDGIPEAGTYAESPLTELTVTFNKPVVEDSFSAADIRLRHEGNPVELTDVAVEPLDNRSFIIHLGGHTSADGYYQLTVATDGIIDTEGFPGRYGLSAGWTQHADGMALVAPSVSPIGAGSVDPNRLLAPIGSAATLTATPNPGYSFSAWTLGSDILSKSNVLELRVAGNISPVASFTADCMSLEASVEGCGEIVGMPEGVVRFGNEIALEAIPAEGWIFTEWREAGECISTDARLSFTINCNRSLSALFVPVEDFESPYLLNSGWNWITPLRAKRSGDAMTPVEYFGNGAQRILAIEGRDADCATLLPGAHYRVLTDWTVSGIVKGYHFDSQVRLAEGWNAIGFTLATALSPAQAFAPLAPAEGDMVKSIDGFSVYTDEGWKGTLDSILPGEGVMYCSAREASFSYPDFAAADDFDSAYEQADSPARTVNARDFSDNMALLGMVVDKHDGPVDQNRYLAAAFCGNECRGLSACIDDVQFITIHGLPGEVIEFTVFDSENGVAHKSQTLLSLDSESAGTLAEPIKILCESIGTGVERVKASSVRAYPNPVASTLYVESEYDIADIALFDTCGVLLLRAGGEEAAAGINVEQLEPGLMIMVVTTAAGHHELRLIKTSH